MIRTSVLFFSTKHLETQRSSYSDEDAAVAIPRCVRGP
jgi:hypothetical protein